LDDWSNKKPRLHSRPGFDRLRAKERQCRHASRAPDVASNLCRIKLPIRLAVVRLEATVARIRSYVVRRYERLRPSLNLQIVEAGGITTVA
jgi:hypothetical protein